MKYIKFDLKNNIGIITLNNPSALNALKKQLINELFELITSLESNKDLRVLILTGEGKAFAAGSDITELQGMSTYEAKEYSIFGNKLLKLIENFRVPVIAAVNGFALGGGLELMLSCDFAYASDDALFGLPELKLGVIPGFGGCKRLSDRIGNELAKELVYTGRFVDAKTAKEYKIVNNVCKQEELIETVTNLAESISKMGANAISEAKELLNICNNNTYDSVAEVEANKFGLIFSSQESKDGIENFITKQNKK